jgi:NAD(P)-dependent dehydrogenase (short-subunit alcohol dehydrogenase family)
MDKKICILTGANAGIGREAAQQIARKGFHVIMACRNEKRGMEALEAMKSVDASLSLEVMIVDLSLQSSIRSFADKVKSAYPVIDVLIHNAAAFDYSQKDVIKTGENIEMVWATNHLGPVLLTELLLENIKKSEQGRIITIASKGLVVFPFMKVDLEDPEFNKRKFTITKAYYQSKRAQVMYTYWLADQMKGSKVTVNCIRVTNVKIDLNRYPDVSAFGKWMYSIKSKKSIAPEQMAETYTWMATSPDVSDISGRYFDENHRQVSSVKYTYDTKKQQDLMKLTMTYMKDHG